MKKIGAILHRGFWSDIPSRINAAGLVLSWGCGWSKAWPCVVLTYLGQAVLICNLGCLMIRVGRDRAAWKRYQASHAVTVAELAKLMSLPPTASNVLIDSTFEQTDARVQEHGRLVEDLQARWGTKKK